MYVYGVRSFGLLEAGKLLLENVKEVLPVWHLVRCAAAWRASVASHLCSDCSENTSGSPHSAASLGDRIALDLVVHRWVFLVA